MKLVWKLTALFLGYTPATSLFDMKSKGYNVTALFLANSTNSTQKPKNYVATNCLAILYSMELSTHKFHTSLSSCFIICIRVFACNLGSIAK